MKYACGGAGSELKTLSAHLYENGRVHKTPAAVAVNEFIHFAAGK